MRNRLTSTEIVAPDLRYEFAELTKWVSPEATKLSTKVSSCRYHILLLGLQKCVKNSELRLSVLYRIFSGPPFFLDPRSCLVGSKIFRPREIAKIFSLTLADYPETRLKIRKSDCKWRIGCSWDHLSSLIMDVAL
jgi:hypothetical protein